MRRLIREVPRDSFLGPIGLESRVEPRGDKWEWSVWFTFDGHRSLIGYLDASFAHPSPYEVRGRERHQHKAEERARAALEDARSRWAAKQYDENRADSCGQTTRLPL